MMSTQTDRIRGLVHTGASLLRSGANVLDRLAGSEGAQEDESRFSRPGDQGGGAPGDLDDVTLARKVESIAFREAGVDQGSINVNAADGVVFLRGEAQRPEDVRALVAAAEAIPEVERVENLLHLPGTPAPTRTDTPVRQRKEAGRRSRPRSAKVHVTPDPVTEEAPVEQAEPSPARKAKAKRGRSAAPMGSKGAGRGGASGEPSIDPQPGELGEGRVDVEGGTEITGGRATGSGGGAGSTGTAPGGRSGGTR